MKSETNPDIGSNQEETGYTEVALTFEGLSVSSPWYHPDLGPVVCALCGKKCQELGKPVCVNVNPYCG